MAGTTTIVFEDHRMVITMPDKVIVLRPLDIRQATVVNNSNRPDRGSLQFASPPQVPYPSLTLKLLTEWGDEVDINLSEVSEPASWNNGESGAKDALIDLTPYIRKDPPVSSGDVTIVTTDNLTTVDANEPGPTYSLRQTTIAYTDAAGAPALLAAVNTGYDGAAYLVPDQVVPRREMTRNGVPTGTFIDLDDLVSDTVPDIMTGDWETTFAQGDGQTLHSHVNGRLIAAEMAGLWNVTSDGGSGTLEYSINGGAWTTLGSTITYTAGQRVRFRRSITTSLGYITQTR